MRLLVFCFHGNISERLATHVDRSESIIELSSSYTAISEFVENTDFGSYDYVLGLGMYSGKDKDSIRVETECNSKFRNTGSGKDRLSIPYFFKPVDGMKLAKGIGNSWCNLVSFKLLSKYPNSKYTFLHIPKKFDVDFAARIINQQLLNLG